MSEQTLRHQVDQRWAALVPTTCDTCFKHRRCVPFDHYITSTLTGEVYGTVTVNTCEECLRYDAD